MIKIALVGNPNSGKSSVFNALTGANQYVGNWPGVTVEKKEGKLKADKSIRLIDLPGIYSLSPYSVEEVVSRNYLIKERPDCILNIVDGTNLERNLYLTTQLIELNIPIVIAVNMIDVVEKSGDYINLKLLQKAFGCPVLAVSALKKQGLAVTVEKTVEVARDKKLATPQKFFSEKLEHFINKAEKQLPNDFSPALRKFVAIKLLERDRRISDYIQNPPNVQRLINAVNTAFNESFESVITNERYNFITALSKRAVGKGYENTHSISDRIDSVLTNRFLALPLFAVIIFALYYISVSSLGGLLLAWTNDHIFGEGFILNGLKIPGVPIIIESFLQWVGCADWLNSLILDGIVGSVGAVLGFVPQMFLLFFLLGFLEYCGYMSRIAFVLDCLFKSFGFSGKSFIPLLLGTGCSVPGIMASRTIESAADRKITIITTSFMPCSAKIPIIALIAGTFFDGAWWVAPSAYFVGAFAVVISGVILKKSGVFASDISPFVMELPAYRLPRPSALFRNAGEKSLSFIKKAGTIILVSGAFIWFFSNFGFTNGNLTYSANANNSLFSSFGNMISWIFMPLGFGTSDAAVASLTGVIAKENLAGTLAVLHSSSTMSNIFTPLSAYSFLIFNLLCVPCVAAVATIYREMNSVKLTFFAVSYQCAFAYAVALCFYQFGLLFSGVFSFYTILAVIVLLFMLYMIFRENKSIALVSAPTIQPSKPRAPLYLRRFP